MHRCNECGEATEHDERRGEIVCVGCGKVAEDNMIDGAHPAYTAEGGQWATEDNRSGADRNAALGSEMTLLDIRLGNGKTIGLRHYLLDRRRRYRHRRANDIKKAVKAMGLGKSVQNVAHEVVMNCFTHSEKEMQDQELRERLAPLPRNELRFIRKKQVMRANYAIEVSAVAVVMAISKLGLMEPFLWRQWLQEHELDENEVLRAQNSILARIDRLSLEGMLRVRVQRDPEVVRSLQFASVLGHMTQWTRDNLPHRANDIINDVYNRLKKIGEPTLDGAIPNAMPDMLIGMMYRLVFIDQKVGRRHGAVADALGRCPASIKQRVETNLSLLQKLGVAA